MSSFLKIDFIDRRNQKRQRHEKRNYCIPEVRVKNNFLGIVFICHCASVIELQYEKIAPSAFDKTGPVYAVILQNESDHEIRHRKHDRRDKEIQKRYQPVDFCDKHREYTDHPRQDSHKLVPFCLHCRVIRCAIMILIELFVCHKSQLSLCQSFIQECNFDVAFLIASFIELQRNSTISSSLR